MLTMDRVYLESGTFGKIKNAGSVICCTVERPYLSNRPNISCVPPGEYELIRHNSPKHGDTYALKNHDLGVGVMKGDSHRWGILIHVANFPEQLEGCIAPGESLHPEKWGVAYSAKATEKLLAHLRAMEKAGMKLTIMIK